MSSLFLSPVFKFYICSNSQKYSFTHHGLFELIGFDTAYEERLTDAQRPHEQLEWALKLTAKSRGALPCLHSLKTEILPLTSQKNKRSFTATYTLHKRTSHNATTNTNTMHITKTPIHLLVWPFFGPIISSFSPASNKSHSFIISPLLITFLQELHWLLVSSVYPLLLFPMLYMQML